MKIKIICFLICFLFSITACAVHDNQKEDVPKNRKEIGSTYHAGNTTNGSIIYDSFVQCQDYSWLKQIGFLPCQAVEKKIGEIQENMTIKKMEDISFINCNITGGNRDVIMRASVFTDIFDFDIMLLFVDYNEEAVFDFIAQKRTLDYQLVDLDGNGISEIVIECLGLNKSRKHMGIYCFEREIVPILEKNVDSFQYDLSYQIVDGQVKVRKTKYYYNKNNKKKKARVVEYTYMYNGNNMKQTDKKVVWKSKRKDFKAWTLG